MKRSVLITSGNAVSDMGMSQRRLHQNYADCVSRAGMLPLLAVSFNDAQQLAAQFDSLLLTGGADISPALYGEFEHERCELPETQRDCSEMALLRAFVELGKPVFGICRGAQLINVFFGGTLFQDLPSQRGVNHSGGVAHQIRVERGSRLSKILEDQMVVNSFHHQSINRLGEKLRVVALSKDGVIEAVEHETLPVFAVQWHPERMADLDSVNQSIFNVLF